MREEGDVRRGEAVSCKYSKEEVVLDGWEELGDVESEGGGNKTLLPGEADVVDEHGGGVDGGRGGR